MNGVTQLNTASKSLRPSKIVQQYDNSSYVDHFINIGQDISHLPTENFTTPRTISHTESLTTTPPILTHVDSKSLSHSQYRVDTRTLNSYH